MTINLLKDLDFAAKLNSAEAVTESGKEVLKNYRGYMFFNPCTCGIVNGFVKEAQQYSYDKGMMSILESVLSFINENNISWKLATACESISNNNSTYNYIARLGINKVTQLLEMKENEVVSYIKAGALKNVQYIPEFRAICKEVFKSNQVSEAKTQTYQMTTPVSYVEVDECGGQFVSILGKTYKINEGTVETVEEAFENMEQFNKINAHLGAFAQVGDALVYEFKSAIGGEAWKFTINEESLSVEHRSVNESFETVTEFRNFCDTASRIMSLNEKKQFMNICNAVGEVFESIDSICAIDCARIIKASNNTVGAIIEGKESVLFASNGEVKEYAFAIEALNECQRVMGVDVKVAYEDRINEDVKKGNPEQYKQIEEELEASKDAQFEIRYKKIEKLAESLKNDPAAIAVLNSLTKDLKMLENAE